MRASLSRAIGAFLRASRLGLFPVRVRSGLAAGARWSLYPCSAYWRGAHEPALQAAMLGLNGGDIRGWSCWDLGAHFGLYSIGLARRVGPAGAVAAFEPNPLSFARLQLHARRNPMPWLGLFPAAVSDAAGSAKLYTYGSLDRTDTHLPYADETLDETCQPLAIRTVRLDDLAAKGEIRPPDFVKVDVEGHGHRALAGMSGALRARRPILIAAFHSQEEVDGMLGLIEPLGYERSEIPTHSGSPHPIIGRDFLFTPRR